MLLKYTNPFLTYVETNFMFSKEGELYSFILQFLTEKFQLIPKYSGFTYSDGVDKDQAKSLTLRHFGIQVKPDVFGVTESEIIIMAEGKVQCGGTNLDTAIGQAVTYQRFSHYSYVFFPQTELEGIEDYVISALERHGLGLLSVSPAGKVEELFAPQLSPFLREGNDTQFLHTFGQVVKTRGALADLDPYNDDNEKVLESGPRAYLIRDFCFWFANHGDKMEDKSTSNLAKEFVIWINKYTDEKKFSESKYWTSQFAGAKSGQEASRSLAAIYGSIYFEMLESNEEDPKLTELGRALISVSSNIGKSELNHNERVFFYIMAWKSPSARQLIEIMKKSTGKVSIHTNACGHWNIKNINGNPKCVDEDRILDYEDLSISGRLKFEYGEDISYYKKTFWLRSEIFTTSGKSKIEYRSISLKKR